MTDDSGWNDFGAYSNGGATKGHPTSSVDRVAKEGPSSRAGTYNCLLVNRLRFCKFLAVEEVVGSIRTRSSKIAFYL
jgi:hypothetical protein